MNDNNNKEKNLETQDRRGFPCLTYLKVLNTRCIWNTRGTGYTLHAAVLEHFHSRGDNWVYLMIFKHHLRAIILLHTPASAKLTSTAWQGFPSQVTLYERSLPLIEQHWQRLTPSLPASWTCHMAFLQLIREYTLISYVYTLKNSLLPLSLSSGLGLLI